MPVVISDVFRAARITLGSCACSVSPAALLRYTTIGTTMPTPMTEPICEVVHMPLSNFLQTMGFNAMRWYQSDCCRSTGCAAPTAGIMLTLR